MFSDVLQKCPERVSIMDQNSFFYLCDFACPDGVRSMQIHFVSCDTFSSFFFSRKDTKKSVDNDYLLVFEEILEN